MPFGTIYASDYTGNTPPTLGTDGTDGSSSPAGLGSFLYTSNNSAQTVPLESAVIFDSPGVSSPGFTHLAGTPTIEVLISGTYAMSFSVTGVEPNQFALFANGALMPATTYGSGSLSQQTSGQAIVTLDAGDLITLRNHTSTAAVTLQTVAGGTATNVNASLIIERLTR